MCKAGAYREKGTGARAPPPTHRWGHGIGRVPSLGFLLIHLISIPLIKIRRILVLYKADFSY